MTPKDTDHSHDFLLRLLQDVGDLKDSAALVLMDLCFQLPAIRAVLLIKAPHLQIYARMTQGQDPQIAEPLEELDELFDLDLAFVDYCLESGSLHFDAEPICQPNIWGDDTEIWRVGIPLIRGNMRYGVLYAEALKAPTNNRWLLSDSFVFITTHLCGEMANFVLSQQVKTEQANRVRTEEALLSTSKLTDHFLRQFIALQDISLKMSAANTEHEVCKIAVTQVMAELDIDRIAIFLINERNGKLYGTWGTSDDGEISDESDFISDIPDHPMVHQALARKDHVVVNDHAVLYYYKKPVGTGWNAMVSMWDGEHAIGWIAADNLINRQPMQGYQKELLKLLGANLGQIIIRTRTEAKLKKLNYELEQRVAQRTAQLEETNNKLARVNSQLELLSQQDSLTGLANRRILDECIDREWARAVRHKKSLALIMIDVDFFKPYNDELGHLAGDRCLKSVAQLLKSWPKRATDLVARFGGEEFVLLLPNTELEQALSMAQNIREDIERLKIPHPHSSVSSYLTISLGVAASIPALSSEPEELLMLADDALYLAKEQGRNRVAFLQQSISRDLGN